MPYGFGTVVQSKKALAVIFGLSRTVVIQRMEGMQDGTSIGQGGGLKFSY